VDSRNPTKKIREALNVLEALCAPREQQNERSALTLLALADIRPKSIWKNASAPTRQITEMMEWMNTHYGIKYAPNTRETIRRQTVHQFVQMGLLLENPDCPNRPINSPKWCYQLTPTSLSLLQAVGGRSWKAALAKHQKEMSGHNRLITKHRNLRMVPITLPKGQRIRLSTGGQNVLIKKIIELFCPRFAPGGEVLLVGDAKDKNVIEDDGMLTSLGIDLEARGKSPDVVVYDRKRDWLIVVEAVTSHGPIDQKRRNEITDLFSDCRSGIVFVTAFEDIAGYAKFARSIAWETEVWIADAPDHLIHYNGSRFLGPYDG
jgi:adenine-specific DNA-methyltransferase